MWCNLCGKLFNRGTTSLPNYCNECLKNMTYEVIEPTQEEINKNYTNLINTCLKSIEKSKKEISDCEEIIEYAETQIK